RDALQKLGALRLEIAHRQHCHKLDLNVVRLFEVCTDVYHLALIDPRDRLKICQIDKRHSAGGLHSCAVRLTPEPRCWLSQVDCCPLQYTCGMPTSESRCETRT